MSTSNNKDDVVVQQRGLRYIDESAAEEAATQLFESAITDADNDAEDEDVRWLREQRMHHKSVIWYKRPTVPLFCSALLVFFLSTGVSLSAKVILMLEVVCRHIGEVEQLENCHNAKVQETVSSLQSLVTFIIGLSSCLIAGKVGELSDRFGRKPIFIVLAFFTLTNRLFALLVYTPSFPFHRLSFVILAILESLGGGTIVTLSVAYSYITDLVEPHKRIVSLGFVIGSLYVSLATGPVIGSLLIKSTGSNFSALYLDTFLAFTFLLMTIFIIQESRSEKFRTRSQSIHLQRKASFASQASARKSFSGLNTSSLQLWRLVDVFSPLKTLWIPRHPQFGLAPRINVLILIFVDVLAMTATISMTAPLILYCTYQFDWNSETIGYFVSVVGVSKTFILYCFAPVFLHLLRKIFKSNNQAVDYIDFSVIVFGMFSEFLSPLIIIAATSSHTVFSSGVLSSFGAIAMPTLQASIVKYVPEGKVGEVFGALSLLKNVLVMLGPPGFLYIYSSTIDRTPAFVFYVAAGLLSTALASSLLLKTNVKANEASNYNSDVESNLSTESSSLLVTTRPLEYDSARSNGRVSFSLNESPKSSSSPNR